MANYAQPDTGGRAGHVTFGIIGTVLLVVGCGATLLVGAFSGFLTDTCSAGDTSAKCRNIGWVMLALIGTPLVAGIWALVATWRTKKRGRPRGWAPFLGIIALAAAWVAASLLVPDTFLF